MQGTYKREGGIREARPHRSAYSASQVRGDWTIRFSISLTNRSRSNLLTKSLLCASGLAENDGRDDNQDKSSWITANVSTTMVSASMISTCASLVRARKLMRTVITSGHQQGSGPSFSAGTGQLRPERLQLCPPRDLEMRLERRRHTSRLRPDQLGRVFGGSAALPPNFGPSFVSSGTSRG